MLYLGIIFSLILSVLTFVPNSLAAEDYDEIAVDTVSEDPWDGLGYGEEAVLPENIEMETDDSQSITELPDGPEAIQMEKSSAQAYEPVKTTSYDNISTVENTHGVLTEEKPPLQFYASPFAGVGSLFGSETVETAPRFATGVNAGVLISSNMLLQAGYTYAQYGVSTPVTLGTYTPEAYNANSHSFEAGARMFFLGRESRFRPFFGGGLGYGTIRMNYATSVQPSTDFKIDQFKGYGEVGMEVAFTRMIVATAMVKFNGVLSHSNSLADQGSSYDNSTATAGDAITRAASYTLGAGLGFYF